MRRIPIAAPSSRPVSVAVILAPGAVDCGVRVPVEEWMPGLLLHVAFVTHFDGELKVRA